MVIKKKKQTFNDYDVQLSWGQLNAIFKALEQDHADPLADELFAELGWYLENVPGPGEDEDEYKEAKEAERQAVEGGDEGAGGGQPNPDLVGQEVGPSGEPEGAGGPVPPQEEPGTDDEADQFLERPPGQDKTEPLAI